MLEKNVFTSTMQDLSLPRNSQLLKNQNAPDHEHKSPTLKPILSQLNPLHNCKVHFSTFFMTAKAKRILSINDELILPVLS
jgi:hypothetical protein